MLAAAEVPEEFPARARRVHRWPGARVAREPHTRVELTEPKDLRLTERVEPRERQGSQRERRVPRGPVAVVSPQGLMDPAVSARRYSLSCVLSGVRVTCAWWHVPHTHFCTVVARERDTRSVTLFARVLTPHYTYELALSVIGC